ncbi:MAG TPA: DUF423 domain-containing protein [Burkholderiales bacterium]|nr:DUF423 domain-containing protein [Burkholderiales bacterium]
MLTSPPRTIAVGAAATFLAVLLGAFGAHTLRAALPPEALTTWHTAVEYHFYSALGLIAMGLFRRGAADLVTEKRMRWAARLMLAGIVLFSGSLYALAFTGVRGIGAITPIGGLSLLAAWALFAYAAWKSKDESS